MKKLFFLTLTLGALLFIGCTVNEKDELMPTANTETSDQEQVQVDGTPDDNLEVTERIPCSFKYEYTATNYVTICGDFDAGCSYIPCIYCGSSSGGRNLPSPSGTNLWMSGGHYSVRNANTHNVTFKIRRVGASTWNTFTIPAYGGEIYLYAYGINGVWYIIPDPTPPC